MRVAIRGSTVSSAYPMTDPCYCRKRKKHFPIRHYTASGLKSVQCPKVLAQINFEFVYISLANNCRKRALKTKNVRLLLPYAQKGFPFAKGTLRCSLAGAACCGTRAFEHFQCSNALMSGIFKYVIQAPVIDRYGAIVQNVPGNSPGFQVQIIHLALQLRICRHYAL